MLLPANLQLFARLVYTPQIDEHLNGVYRTDAFMRDRLPA